MNYLQASEDLWICAAQRLTNVIQQIIEFAKMVPGFMQFPQEDQIVLLKAGTRAVVEIYYLILNSIVNCFIFREL